MKKLATLILLLASLSMTAQVKVIAAVGVQAVNGWNAPLKTTGIAPYAILLFPYRRLTFQVQAGADFRGNGFWRLGADWRIGVFEIKRIGK